jgi:hypothetical protein
LEEISEAINELKRAPQASFDARVDEATPEGIQSSAKNTDVASSDSEQGTTSTSDATSDLARDATKDIVQDDQHKIRNERLAGNCNTDDIEDNAYPRWLPTEEEGWEVENDADIVLWCKGQALDDRIRCKSDCIFISS